MNWGAAKIIDFTGALKQGVQSQSFNSAVQDMLREPTELKLAIVLDNGFGFKRSTPYMVTDHLNLSGNNPLIGPNNPIGERFPVVNGIYVTEVPQPLMPGITRGIAAGLKPGLKPSSAELEKIHALGADFYCYNLVPTMLVAAHAGWRILGVVGPESASTERNWQRDLMASITKMTW